MIDVTALPFSDWSIRPERDEPAHGYYTRLAALNGATSVVTYSTVIDVRSRYIVPEDLLSVVEDLPIGAEAIASLQRSTPVLGDTEYTLCGEVFAQRDLSFSTRRRCPACIHEKAYHRAWWDILAISRCPYHRVEIVDVDPTGRPIGWWWPDFAVTEAGIDLGVAGIDRSLEEGTFGRYLLGRLGYEPPVASSFLDGLSAREVIDLCDLFGRLLANEWYPSIPDRSVDTMDHGYNALANGLLELRKHLARWLLTVPRDHVNATAATAYSWAYATVKAMPNRKLALAVHNAMRGALSDIVVGGDGDDDLEARIHLTALAARMGVDRRGLYSLVTALAGGKSGKRRKLWVTNSQADVLAGHAETLMTRTAAAEALGLPSWELANLEEAGFLIGIRYMSRNDVDGMRYLRRDIDRALAIVADLPLAADGGISILTYARQNSMSPGQVAADLLGRRLPAGRIDNDEAGFRSVRVASNRGYAYRKSALDTDVVSTVEATAMTNLDYRTICELADAGRLGPNNRSASLRTFERGAVESFAARYRPAIEFAVPLGLSTDSVLDRLRDADVEVLNQGPARNPPVDRAAAILALGLYQDPTVIEDVEFTAFWSDLLRQAADRIPYFRFPNHLPTAGQRVWRSNRKISVFLQYDPEQRGLNGRRAHGKVDPAVDVQECWRIADGPGSVIRFIETLNSGVTDADTTEVEVSMRNSGIAL